ncbi:MAG TPA: flagellar basal body L-ring protein FlgH [Gammaproteobacteria bacterium]|nr:flagellar basal body L-ring protein FlgH [Gammaproteobacteria bacterium]HBF08378.1 flagellar basal body L-ring protein FlgH [Gammaproteobacteria bacterium]HCK93179.1 flagellar basal body L-ring protein FlgH [Gammaproteobacteria bacterium]
MSFLVCWRVKMKYSKRLYLLFLTLSLFLQGCAGPQIIPDDPEYAPVIPNIPAPQGPQNGSLFQSTGLSLWNDQRARQVGDILTVILEESTTSSKSSATSVVKDGSFSMGAPTIMGTTPSTKLLSRLSPITLESEASAARDSSGEAAANQQNNLSGQLAVTVQQVLPNGVLVIKGEKWLQLTEGQEFLRISGLVRPSDVRQDNSVSSTKIADARITFSGEGQFADAHKVGWLARFFNSKFWPY